MTVTFHTDETETHNGFRMVYGARRTDLRRLVCPASLNQSVPEFGSGQVFSDGKFGENLYDYSTGKSCSFGLTAPHGFIIEFRLRFIDIGPADSLVVSDESGLELLSQSVSGVKHLVSYARYYSATNRVSVRFTSSSSGYEGFQLMFYVVPTGIVCNGSQQAVLGPDDSGSLVSHRWPSDNSKYPNRADCSLTVTAPDNVPLTVRVLYLDLEEGRDTLTLQDPGAGSAPSSLSEAAGKLPVPRLIHSTSNALVIRFRSESRNSRTGFHLTFEANGAACKDPGTQDVTLGQHPGEIFSHAGQQHGSPYGSNLDCNWTLIAPTNSIVFVWFSYMSLETLSDQVQLWDADGSMITAISQDVGIYSSPGYSAGFNSMTVRLATNNNVSLTGFRLHYTAMPVQDAYACSGSQQLFVSPSSEPGTLVSHNLFGSGSVYANGLSCDWTLRAPVGYEIVIWFTHVDLEPGADSVSVFDGSSLLQEVSQLDQPLSLAAIVADSGTARVQFTTNSNLAHTGFELRFKARPRVRTWACSGHQVVLADFSPDGSALVSHPGFGFGSLYASTANCSFAIVAPADSTGISAWFTHADLESCCDSVSLFDGAGSPLARLSASVGNFSSSVYRSASRLMTIRFETDGSGTRTGFRLLVFPEFRTGTKFHLRSRAPPVAEPQSPPAAIAAARSDIECAVLCAGLQQQSCKTGEFMAEPGLCRLHGVVAAGFEKLGDSG